MDVMKCDVNCLLDLMKHAFENKPVRTLAYAEWYRTESQQLLLPKCDKYDCPKENRERARFERELFLKLQDSMAVPRLI